MGLLSSLGTGPVALDSSIFIYFIEKQERFLSELDLLFSAIAEGTISAVTSCLTLLEVLVVPLRADRPALAAEYEEILTRSPAVSLLPLQPRQLRLAAHLRASTGMKTPDALHLASALVAGCTTFLTNDRRIPPVPGLRIVVLEDAIAEPHG